MGAGHDFEASVLREYDIRGIVGETLHEADLHAIGRAFGTILRREIGSSRKPSVTVGYDGRISSPNLEQHLVAGLTESGVDVIRIGIGPTPMLYFSVFHHETDGGLMITGSHNPPDYNGIKMMIGHGPFWGERIRELGAIANTGDFETGEGQAFSSPVFDEYVERLNRDMASLPPLKVAWDAGNGATGDALTRLAGMLPGEHILLNEVIDGTFPAHHPDPTVPKYLTQLIETVKTQKCDLGIAFDGDGDRIGVIDGDGEIIWGDQIIALLARDVLKELPGSTIIADVKASQVLFDEITRLGGKPLMWNTGHSVIKAKMAELKSPLAGEMSGHIFFADHWYGFDDAIYAALRLLAVIGHEGKSASELRRALPACVNTPEIRFDCADERKFTVIEEVRDRLAALGADFIDIDGVRVNSEDGWWLLRASNTQPVLVARCEADDDTGLARLKEALETQLRASGIEPPDF